MAFINPEICWHLRMPVGPAPAATSITPLRGVRHPRAPKILAYMRQQGRGPVSLWKVVNALAKAESKETDDRDQRRFRRLCVMFTVCELCRVKLIYRHYNEIATTEFGYRPRRRPGKSLLNPVGKSDSEKPGSNRLEAQAGQIAQTSKATTTSLPKAPCVNQTAKVAPAKTKYAQPSPEQISCAAAIIAMRPRARRKNRKFTGYFNGERIRTMTPFRVPTGETLPAFLVRRGKVYVMRSLDTLLATEVPRLFMERFDASEVRRIKNPAAMQLGKLKAGKKERPSEAKRRACLANSSKPPRPGSRPRGRPRRSGGAGGPLGRP